MRKTGIYLCGNFWKGRKSDFMLSLRKPFKIDTVTGEVEPLVLVGFKNNFAVQEWEFMEGITLKTLAKNNEHKAYMDGIWKMWCEKHKRKYKSLFHPYGQ